ncbi:hypothetical protein HYC85_011328 [Camellia sinensis]|uniref:Aconitase/3-isopropylmalate dehydratase large subunit alpha/beta/alpha domain-containing protein n=1 Tax=Camellia sinensis TaxID=4442 RepID=A0A7J7H9S0_CAMSI|nr:hypothetical protein HYC85_011328 [Camellia sinensis]
MRDHRQVYNQSAALPRASRTKFLSSSPSLSTAAASCSSSRAHSSPSITNQCRSFSFSSVFRSVPQWSNGVDWKSPATLTLSEGSPPWVLKESYVPMKFIRACFQRNIDWSSQARTWLNLPALNDPRIDMLPYSIRILLESAIRNCDNFQDFTGVPALVDLACMRDAMNKIGSDSNKINPLVPVDLVIDQDQKMQYRQIWSLNSKGTRRDLLFSNGGQMHSKTCLLFLQVLINLEYLGCFVFNTDGMLYPDSMVGTDSHTTMIDGLGVAGWGVGGIEAEAAMLGQLSGKLRDGVTATDLLLTMTQMLRKHGVVGKFVKLYGEGVSKISLADRATIANMSPEYGATMGLFPVDHVALQYLKLTRRSEETPQQERAYSSYLHLDLADVEPCISGPKRPHDQVPLKEMKRTGILALTTKLDSMAENDLLAIPTPHRPWLEATGRVFLPPAISDGRSALIKNRDNLSPNCSEPIMNRTRLIIPGHSGTSTRYRTKWKSFRSTDSLRSLITVVLSLLLSRAAQIHQTLVKSWIKTSLTPGYGVVTKYLLQSGLQKYLNEHGFHIVGCGCTTCIGNSGDLDESVASAISKNDIVAAAVLSGNQNFKGRVHPLTRANYLASPLLVVAYAFAGTCLNVYTCIDKELSLLEATKTEHIIRISYLPRHNRSSLSQAALINLLKDGKIKIKKHSGTSHPTLYSIEIYQ